MTGAAGDLLKHVEELSDQRIQTASPETRKRWGQYFTSASVATYMASLLPEKVSGDVRLLDPGAGIGILGIAAASWLLSRGASSVELVAVEPEADTVPMLKEALGRCEKSLGSKFRCNVIQEDFLALAKGNLFLPNIGRFDFAISNPPYFKMSPADNNGGDAPNIYARFMEVTAGLLEPHGKMCFIIPRSFASGFYFKKFRKRFLSAMQLERIHIFEFRKDAFKNQGVLQENIITVFSKEDRFGDDVSISVSNGDQEISGSDPLSVPRSRLLDNSDRQLVLSLPISEGDLELLNLLDGWRSRLHDYGLEISTGPVVPFRAREVLLRQSSSRPTYPMLWMQHVRAGCVSWPLGESFRKEEHILADADPKLLVRDGIYVLLRRFSAKEEPRRLTAAVLQKGSLSNPFVGLENHLNYIHRPGGELQVSLARGLEALLNSSVLDNYFRMTNGNTQVSATEIRSMPLPDFKVTTEIGRRLSKKNPDSAESIVLEVLHGKG